MRRIAFLTLFLLGGCVAVPPSGTGSAPATAPAPAVSEPEPVKLSPPAANVPAVTTSPSEPVSHNAAPRMLALVDFVDRNDDNLLSVYPGMSRTAVERIMSGYRTGSATNPYKRQQIAAGGGKTYEVLFYLTRKPRPGYRVSEVAMTPVIFENDRVSAIGRYPLKKLRRSACQVRGEPSCP